PIGKLEQVKRTCELNSKPFEYAFLLDALVDEQAQGITIDTARVFFKTSKREYIIIDAPGHIEFLKNMISGAARAEAAILLIDAHEGIAENSKRHAYMLSLLGIKQIAVAINKMDLVNYSESKFNEIKNDYVVFLKEIGIEPIAFVPISARNGFNLIEHSNNMTWYKGKTILELIDSFEKEKGDEEKNFRMFVQGVYKFTENGDNRRIIAGTINSGTINVGDEIIFLPSNKKSTVKTIEIYGKESPLFASVEQAIGLTLTTQVYVKPGDLICRTDQQLPFTTNRFKANIFWMGKNLLSIHKKYKLKIGTNKAGLNIEKIITVMNASNLESTINREEVHRNEVAQIIFKTDKPISFDLFNQIKTTGRFVIVDEYDIAGGGIIVEALEEEEKPAKVDYSEFEKELYQLIKKYFPHWEIKPIF
ncbi:MAG: GTP-binding protein, partial [Melioribacter sp.]|nr:GTP-binding protein [Melioribacter sp.]